MTEDAESLRRYAEEGCEEAFAELVQRHLGLVYASALRRVGGDTRLAEAVAQQVFIEVAGRAVCGIEDGAPGPVSNQTRTGGANHGDTFAGHGCSG